jgi:hypothetical protein
MGPSSEVEVHDGDIEEITRIEGRRRTRERGVWGAVVLALIGITAVVIWRATEAPEARPVTHFVLDTPKDLTFGFGGIDAPTVSLDGGSIVMSGRSRDERQHLWIRTLDEPEIRVPERRAHNTRSGRPTARRSPFLLKGCSKRSIS